ncbi:MAG: hypothetical protein ACJ0GM_00815 [Parasynechococcus sp.]
MQVPFGASTTDIDVLAVDRH